MAVIYNPNGVRSWARAAMSRRVGLFLIGDSNVVRSDMGYRTGHAVGNARALADIFGVWGTGIIPGKAASSNNFASSVNGIEKGFGNSLGYGSQLSAPAHITAASLPAWESCETKWNLATRTGTFTADETVFIRATARYTHATRTLDQFPNIYIAVTGVVGTYTLNETVTETTSGATGVYRGTYNGFMLIQENVAYAWTGGRVITGGSSGATANGGTRRYLVRDVIQLGVMQGAQVYAAAGTGVTPAVCDVQSSTATTLVLSTATQLGAGADGAVNIELWLSWHKVVSDTTNVVTAGYYGGYVAPGGAGNLAALMVGATSGSFGVASVVAATGAMATASVHTTYFNGPFGYTATGTVPYNSNALGGYIDQYLMDTGVGMDRRVVDLQDPWTLLTQHAMFSTGSGSFIPTVRRLLTPFSCLTPTHIGVISVATSGTFRPGETLTQETSGATARFIREASGVLYIAYLTGTITAGSAKTWTGGVSSAVCTCSSVASAHVSTSGDDEIVIRATPMVAGMRYKDGYYLGVTNINDNPGGAATAPVAVIRSKFINEKITTGVEQTMFWHQGTQSLREFVGQLFRSDLAQTAMDAMFDMVAAGQGGNEAFGNVSISKSQVYLCVQVSLGQNDASLPDARDALNADGSADTGVASNTQAGHARNWRTLVAKFTAWWASWGGDPSKLCFLAGGMISSPGVDSTYASAFEPALESVAASIPNFTYVKGSALLTSAQTRERGLYGNQNTYATGAAYTEDSTHLSPGGFDAFGRLVWDAVAEATGVLTDGTSNKSMVFLPIETQ